MSEHNPETESETVSPTDFSLHDKGQGPSIIGQQAQVVKHHAEILTELPAPPETFRSRELPEYINSHVRRFAHVGILVVARKGPDGWMHWQVTKEAHDMARAYTTDSNTLPCGHTGISNLREGGFACKRCGEPITREEATEAIR